MILECLVIAQLVANIVLWAQKSPAIKPVIESKASSETIRHSLKEQDGKHIPVIRHDLTTKREWFVDGEPVSEEVYLTNKSTLI